MNTRDSCVPAMAHADSPLSHLSFGDGPYTPSICNVLPSAPPITRPMSFQALQQQKEM
jgi:hypothetical protein